MDPSTIIALKQAFLEIATRQLAQPVAPSRAWQRKNDLRESGHGTDAATNLVATIDGNLEDVGRRLPARIVDDVLVRVNQMLLLHTRRVHSPAAVRHVAEQLDQLYQTASDQLIAVPGDSSSQALDRGANYTLTSAISGLPATWYIQQESDALPLETRRYAEQSLELRTLAERRAATAARVCQLQEMATLLESFNTYANTPQQSLVTRGGPLEAELERMRFLLARVGDRVPSLTSSTLTSSTNQKKSDANGSTGDYAAVKHRVGDVEEVGRERARTLLSIF